MAGVSGMELLMILLLGFGAAAIVVSVDDDDAPVLDDPESF